MRKTILLAFVIAVVFLWIGSRFDMTPSLAPGAGTKILTSDNGPSVFVENPTSGLVREVTAYNVGRRRQTERFSVHRGNGRKPLPPRRAGAQGLRRELRRPGNDPGHRRVRRVHRPRPHAPSVRPSRRHRDEDGRGRQGPRVRRPAAAGRGKARTSLNADRIAMMRFISPRAASSYENRDRAGRRRRFSIRPPGRRAR